MSRPVGKLCGIWLLAGSSLALAQQYSLSTAAGGAPPPTPVGATNTSIGQPNRVTVDSKGNLYFSSSNAVFKIDGSGNLTVVAGNSRAGFSGDGGPALQAQLNGPQGLAFDSNNNLYIADSVNNRVRMVSPAGVITTFAGNGFTSTGGGNSFNDGGLAINGLLRLPSGVCVDSSNNVYIADTGDNIIRKVTTDGIIHTVAGDGFGSYSGDTYSALVAELHTPLDVAVDKSSNIYIADSANAAIREVTASTGIINTIAGSLTAGVGDAGDGGPATSAALVTPYAITVDSNGNVFFVENGDSVIREVNAAKQYIYRVAGNATAGFSGDGSAATKAQLNFPTGLALDSSGDVYIADSLNYRVRKVSGGSISTIAGNGVVSYSGDGGPASSAQLNTPHAVAVDSSGNFYIADTLNNVVRKVSSGGTISTIAGNGTAGYGGDGGSAAAAQLNHPQGIAVDTSGNVYVSDTQNARVRKISGGTITTVAGNGTPGYGGDGGSATAAQLFVPIGLAVDSAGNLYIADFTNERVRKVSGGNITTVAGNGNSGYSGDGGPAIDATLNGPTGVAVDSNGNLYISDLNNNVIREVSGGNIMTVAGNGLPGVGGDGGLATAAVIGNPSGIAVDSAGNLYVASGSATIRKVYAGTGYITTIAGNGTRGYAGDGGPAVAGELNGPIAAAVASNGNVYVADSANNAIRLLTFTGYQLSIAAAANAASNLTGPVSGGDVVVFYGSGMGPAALSVNSVDLSGVYPTSLNGVTVTIGGYPAPILYAEATQLAVVVPFAVSGQTVEAFVQYQGQFSSPFPVTLAQSTPGIFTANLSGQGQAAAINDHNNTFSYNNAANPANAGDYIELYVTGAGPTSPPGVDGQPYGGPANCVLPVKVTIGGVSEVPQYCGGVPGQIAGLTQINVPVPSGLPAGNAAVTVTIGGVSAQSGVTVAVSGH
ncbi:MAG TPA: IPT/TIG domain-containing protein [Bryobacteraceae bacterium]|nr:IPT/TIG domain-containing protein [Bryobacteraceae bacterium]